MSQYQMNKKYKKVNQYPDQNQLLYIPSQYYDEQSNSSPINDLLAPQYYYQKNTNSKKSRSTYGQQASYQLAYSQYNAYDDKHKNQQQKKKQQKSEKLQNSSTYSLSQKLSLSNLSTSKGIKIYVDGLCLFDKFSCKEVSTTEELFLQSSCSSQCSNTNSSINSSASVTSSSSDEEKGNQSCTQYFATFSNLEGPDPSVLDPPTFQFL